MTTLVLVKIQSAWSRVTDCVIRHKRKLKTETKTTQYYPQSFRDRLRNRDCISYVITICHQSILYDHDADYNMLHSFLDSKTGRAWNYHRGRDHPRFADNEKRLEHVDELDEAIQDWMLDHTREEVTDRSEVCEATIAPIYKIANITSDDHPRARDTIVDIEDDRLGTGSVQDVFPRVSDTPGTISHLGPHLGAHNENVYRERLSYSDETLADLEERVI